jgi:predicted CXXCH cytochrome family protein
VGIFHKTLEKILFSKKRFAYLGILMAFILVTSMGVQSCQDNLNREVGTTVCLTCHNGQLAPDRSAFKDSPHYDIGCEKCHGPGYWHVRNGGRSGLFINNLEHLNFEESTNACVQCHLEQKDGFLNSDHATKQAVRCVDCHDVHSAQWNRWNDKNNDLCLHCHASYGFDTNTEIESHTHHPVDPQVTGASRCTGCHMPPLQRDAQASGPHSHSFQPIPPIQSNEAAASGIQPAPPNSCSGIMGCHDGSVVTAPIFDVDNTQLNGLIQILYDSWYGN